MKARIVLRDVRRDLVPGVVLEVNLGKQRRDLQRRLHVAEGRGEDELIAGGRELADDALRIRGSGNTFDKSRLDLGADRFLDLLAAEIVLKRPSRIADRIDVDESHLQRLACSQ